MNFILTALSAVFKFQFIRFGSRKCRSVFPQFLYRHKIPFDPAAARLCKFYPLHSCIHAEHTACAQPLTDILCKRRHACTAHFHQRNARTFKLCLCLNKISAVRKKCCFCLCHCQSSRRAGKPGQVFPVCKICARILRHMIIIGKYYKYVYILIQTQHPLCKKTIFYYIFFFFTDNIYQADFVALFIFSNRLIHRHFFGFALFHAEHHQQFIINAFCGIGCQPDTFIRFE